MGSLKRFFPGKVEENEEFLVKLIVKLGSFKVRLISDFTLLGENAGIKAPFLGKATCGSFSIELIDEDLDATSGPCRIVAREITYNGAALPNRSLDAFYGIEEGTLRIWSEGGRSEVSATLWKIARGKSRLEIRYRKREAKESGMKELSVVLQPRKKGRKL